MQHVARCLCLFWLGPEKYRRRLQPERFMKTISALQEKVVTTGLSHSCCMGNVGGTVHPQLLGGEVLSSSVCIYEDVVRS